jgi:hypothetical protein
VLRIWSGTPKMTRPAPDAPVRSRSDSLAGILVLFLLALFSPLAALVFLAAALAVVALATDAWGLRRRVLGPAATPWVTGGTAAVLLLFGAGAWVAGVSAAAPGRRETTEASPGRPTPTPRPPTAAAATRTAAAQATAGAAPLAEAARAEAAELLGQANAQREAGQAGLALELGRQALGKAPDSGEARSFLATAQPQATAAQRTAVAQATTEARRQATAQAAAAATANLQIVSVTSPAPRNSNATAVVRTVPGAACSISVRYASGVSRAAGLEAKTAGPTGTVSWTWQVGGDTTPGEWPISVSCASGGQRWEQQTSFRVS